MALEIAPRITVDPKVHFGRAVIKGTRVPVDVVIGAMASGMSAEEVADDYGLTVEDILAALSYAAEVLANDETRAVG